MGGEPSIHGSFEVKRLYVVRKCRGTGVVDALMSAVEDLAGSIGAKLLCFETGTRQPEAARVVLRRGYAQIKPYPPYPEDPFAICYAKPLARLEPDLFVPLTCAAR
jgi:GNAT superfamily N-acetyltransferase